MTAPDPQLLAYVRDPANASLSDDALAAASAVPMYTPRADRVTFSTLCSAEVWGFPKAAAFMAVLRAVSAAGSAAGASTATAQAGATAQAALSLLNGSGFNPGDPQAPQIAAGLVPLGGGTITAEDATLAVSTKSYPAGQPWAAADVTAARAYAARQDAANAALSSLMTYSSYVQREANLFVAGTVAMLPAIPGVPS